MLSLSDLVNLVGAASGLWKKRFYNSDATDNFSQESQEQTLNKFSKSMSLNSQQIPGSAGYETYEGTRFRTISGFSSLKTPNGTNIKDALSDTTSADSKKVSDDINKSLELDADAAAAKARFEADMSKIKAFVDDPESTYSPTAIALFITEIRDDAIKAIKEQHAKELAALDANFADPAFNASLKTSLALTSDAQGTLVKKQMRESIQKSQNEALSTFEKEMVDPIKKLHHEAQKERDRVTFLATMSANNKGMQKEIERLYHENRNRMQTAGVSAAQVMLKDDEAIFKGIKVEDVKVIASITGRKITNAGDGSFKMSLPHRMFRPDYYMSSNNNSKQDLLSLVGAVRACGYDAIDIDINSDDEKNGLEIARQAYEAAIEVGFEEKDIVVNLNGKKMTKDDLFSECRDRPQIAASKASKIKEGWKKSSESGPANFDDMKAKIRSYPAAPPTAAPAPVNPTPPAP